MYMSQYRESRNVRVIFRTAVDIELTARGTIASATMATICILHVLLQFQFRVRWLS